MTGMEMREEVMSMILIKLYMRECIDFFFFSMKYAIDQVLPKRQENLVTQT